MITKFMPLSAAISAVIATTPAIAQPLLCSVFSKQAQGLSGERQTVNVLPGVGTNIDFSSTQEFVKKIWLDDFSRVTVDTDAPLCASSMGKDTAVIQDGSCNQGAKIVHLRRIEQLKIPHLPSTPTTLLSIVTENQQQQQMKLYEFQVSYNSKSPKCSRLSILSEPTPQQTANSLPTEVKEDTSLVMVEQGLQVAVARNLVVASSPLIPRVQNFLVLVRQGTLEEVATQQAGISMMLVAKLRSLGLVQQLRQVNTSPLAPQVLPEAL